LIGCIGQPANDAADFGGLTLFILDFLFYLQKSRGSFIDFIPLDFAISFRLILSFHSV